MTDLSPTPRRREALYIAASALVLGGFFASRGDAIPAAGLAILAAVAAWRMRRRHELAAAFFAVLVAALLFAAVARLFPATEAAAPWLGLLASTGALAELVSATRRDERSREETILVFLRPLEALLRARDFGRGKSERCVEVPWALERAATTGRTLEVGHARPEPFYLDALARLPGKKFALDRARKRVPGFAAVQADVRRAPFGDAAFDVVLCISTLEHVGRDNRRYGLGPAEADPRAAMLAAARELGRLVAPGGRLLLTVPFGRARDHGWFANISREDLGAIEAASGLEVEREDFFAYDDGWRRADADGLADRVYQSHGAPAASAIACVALTRGQGAPSPGGLAPVGAKRRTGA